MTRVSQTYNISPNRALSGTATCPGSTWLVGGGFSTPDNNGVLRQSYTASTNPVGGTWTAVGLTGGAGSSMTVYALCAF